MKLLFFSKRGHAEDEEAFLKSRKGSFEKSARKDVHEERRPGASRILSIIFYATTAVCFGLSMGYFAPDLVDLIGLKNLSGLDESSSLTCKDLRIRREWRTLSHAERQAYFDAVHCLNQQPVTMANGTLYDDFPYVHKEFGSYSHKSALFLPWHRYFIHIYEDALVNQCGFKGGLPYWDWTLDWSNIRESPVFGPQYGFGGDGNETGEVVIGGGRCVIDGPFAGLQALRFDDRFAPHCLSRGMLKGELLAKMCGNDIKPDVVEEILQKDTFEEFMHELEEGPHIGISTGIRGDWVKFTVPYDPLWFLHHSQLDRLWWTWQRRAPGRATEYNGRANNLTDARASLSDEMNYGGFAPTMQVGAVMGTESEVLCYRYE